jgi:5-methylcytosine-specific restriction endonuclease McrA
MKYVWDPEKQLITRQISTAVMKLFALTPQCWAQLPPYSELWQTIKNQVLQRDNWRCVECKTNRGIDVYHIVPIKSGGSNMAPNLRTYCRLCQKTKAQAKRDYVFRTNTERSW